MTEACKLHPGNMKRQSEGAISRLNAESEALRIGNTALNAFINDDTNRGLAFDNVRRKMEDFRTAANALIMANDADIADHRTLIGSVGDVVLDGAVILRAHEYHTRKKATADCFINRFKRDRGIPHVCNRQNSSVGESTRSRTCWTNTSVHHAMMIRAYEQKMTDFDRISETTSNLFQTGEALRSSAMRGLEYIQEAAMGLPNIYDSAWLSAWRDDIAILKESIVIETIEETIAERYAQLLERLDGLIADADLMLFNMLFELNEERALSYLELYEAMILASPGDDLFSPYQHHYLVHLIEHVRNRVNAEIFIEDFGNGREFTEEEILLLGVILRFQRPENVNLDGCFREQYFIQVSPFLDGLAFVNIPDHLVPLYNYPIDEVRDIFFEGRKWGPVALALMLAAAGLGDKGRSMTNASNQLPPKPRPPINDRVIVRTNQGNTIDITPSRNHSISSARQSPIRSTPNSSIDFVDRNGQIIKRRWFGSDGRQIRDVDFTNHGTPNKHPEIPHQHGPR